MKILKRLSLIVVCLFTIGLVFGTANAEYKPKIKYLTVYNGSLGGGWHPVASLTAEIIKEAMPSLATKPGPGGGTANAKMLQSGKGKVGMCFTSTAAAAYNGMKPFGKNCTELRHLISMYRLPFTWVARKDSNLTSVAQLGDKRISPAKVGQTTFFLSQETLKTYGITFDSIKKNGGIVNIMGDKERVNMLKDKHLDAIACMFPLNHSNFLNLQVTPGIKLLTMDKEHIQKLMNANPGIAELTIPPGTFQKSQTKPVYTVMAVVNLICRNDLDERLVYEIAKAMINNQKRYAQYVPEADIIMNTPLIGNMIGVHPGAMKYYKEKGLGK